MRGTLQIGSWLVESTLNRISQNGASRHLEPKVMQVLICLAKAHGEVVTKQQVISEVWKDTFVTDDVLTRSISELRDAFGDDARDPKIIQTIPKQGYRLVLPVCELAIDLQQQKKQRRLNQRHVTAVLAAAGLIVIASILFRPLPRLTIGKVTQLTEMSGARNTISTDGRRIYFNDLDRGPGFPMQISVAGGKPAPMDSPFKRTVLADVSRDGTTMLISDITGNPLQEGVRIWSMPVVGGAPRNLDLLANWAYFSPDKSQIVFSVKDALYIAQADGSGKRKLAGFVGWGASPQWSPDGKRIRFVLETPQKSQRSSNLYEVELSSGAMKEIRDAPESPQSGSWTPDGRLFVVNDNSGHLWAMPERQRFSLRRARPQQLSFGPHEVEEFAIDPSGQRLFAIARIAECQLLRLNVQTGKVSPYLGGISAHGVEYSSDKQWIIYSTFPGGVLWRSRPDGSEKLQLTDKSLEISRIAQQWTPDGKHIIFMAWGKDRGRTIYRVPTDGGKVEQLSRGDAQNLNPQLTPDGRRIIFSVPDLPGEKNPGLYEMDVLSGEVKPVPGGEKLFSPIISPDGRFLAALDGHTPAQGHLLDTHTGKWSDLSLTGLEGSWIWSFWRWSPDSRFIYFNARSAKPKGIYRLRIGAKRQELVANLDEIRQFPPVGYWFNFTPEGDLLLMRDLSSEHIYAMDLEED